MHNTKNLLVTGGAGFIGSNFVRYWLTRYPEQKIIVLDALTYAGSRANLEDLENHPNFNFIHANILDIEQTKRILIEEYIDTIVHFAAETHVDRSIQDPDVFIQTNIVGTHKLLKAAKEIWLDKKVHLNHRFHQVSTDEIYGSLDPGLPGFNEHCPFLPSSPYAASKASADHLVRSYHRTYGLNATVSFCSNNYGPYQFSEKLIPLTIMNCLRGLPIRIYGEGRQIRDWIHVDDHIRGLDYIIHRASSGDSFNIGTSNEMQNLEIVSSICRFMDKLHSTGTPHERLVTFVQDRAGHDFRYALDSLKIKTELGFEPEIDLETGIYETVEWYLRNRNWRK